MTPLHSPMTLGTPAAILLAEQLRTFLLREAPAAEARLRPHAPVRGYCVPQGLVDIRLAARALRAAGMVNYQPEWWHWSYGDDEWARAYDCAPLSFATATHSDSVGPGDGI